MNNSKDCCATRKPANAGELCFCLGIGLGHYATATPCDARSAPLAGAVAPEGIRNCACSIKTGPCADHKAQNEMISAALDGPEYSEADEVADAQALRTYTYAGRKFRAHTGCVSGFKADRKAGLIYGPYARPDGTLYQNAEEASVECEFCVYCGPKDLL